MNTEITVLQNELKIAQQTNEILELKYQLQLTQAHKASKLEDSLFSPELYEHYQKVAVMMSKSEIVPNSYRNKPADIFIAMEMGYQLGFPIAQSLQDIAVINGRPCLWGDGLLALVLSHPDCESVNEEPLVGKDGDVIGYKCIVKRKGFEPREQVFTLKDAQSAGLLKKPGPWSQYPKRMLQMRARAFALRDVFGDALRGFKVAEEQQDSHIIDGEVMMPVTNTATQTDKLKQVLGIGEPTNANDSVIDNSDVNEPDCVEHNDLSSSSDDNERSDPNSGELSVSGEQLDRIAELFKEKQFDEARINKALIYYDAFYPSELTYKNAQKLIKQLEKAQ